MPYRFRIRQYDEGLIVSRQWWDADGTRKRHKLDLGDGLPPGALTLVTITSAEQGTVVYLSGDLKETYPKLRFTTSDWIGNDIRDGRELQIPKIYQVPLHTFLTVPWNEFE